MAKRQSRGRFIRKDNPVMKHLSLLEYSFAELSAKYSARFDADNPGSNIISRVLHDDAEMGEMVKAVPSFDQPLADETRQSRIIMPGDFTRDFESMRSKKNMNGDDNEEIGRLYEEEIFRKAKRKSAQKITQSRHDADGGHGDAPAEPGEGEAVADAGTEQPPGAGEAGAFRIVGGKARTEHLESLSQRNPEQAQELKSLGRQKPQPDDSFGPAGNDRHRDANDHDAHDGELQSEQEQDSFIPSFSSHADPAAPEAASLAAYREQLRVEAAGIEELKQKATAEGFEGGFRHGEATGLAQAKGIAQELFNALQQLMSDLEGLRQDLLRQANDNFYEIAQALSETLIGREMNLEPSAFAALIGQAINDILPADQFAVKVSPEMMERLKRIAVDPKLIGKIIADAGLAGSDFVIDSKLSSLRADLPGLIAGVIDRIRTPIFNEAHVTGKAG